ncbi:MAG: hypothetical protein SGJ05_03135 [bacterium]|nr:hypothetical protein [bacterium]
MIPRKSYSLLVVIIATRLAKTIAQVNDDVDFGLSWLDRTRSKLIELGLFDIPAEREYLLERVFLFTHTHKFKRGIIESRKVIALSVLGSNTWYQGMSNLVGHLLDAGRYSEAHATATAARKQKATKKRPLAFVDFLNIRALYAQTIIGARKTIELSPHVAQQHYTDTLVIAVFTAAQYGNADKISEAITTLHRHVARKPALKKEVPLWLLARLLKKLSDSSLSLTAARKSLHFTDYEAALSLTSSADPYETLLEPRALWQLLLKAIDVANT